MSIVINKIAHEIASKTGQKHNNVHASISKLVKTIGIDEIQTLEYKVVDSKFTGISINSYSFSRDPSNRWIACDDISERALSLGKQANEYAKSMMFYCPKESEAVEHEQTEALVFEHNGKRLIIPVSDEIEQL